ncbi:hypothetical protein [Paenibacillus sp. HB172176]|uniref:hypothetical protein n=1 Tax=Paenibacillus sp. HB172176 TaxID=2493690 RepID=UPI001438A5E9|nr:hypothetical protein [Paenibacillus sp. HB172176]
MRITFIGIILGIVVLMSACSEQPSSATDNKQPHASSNTAETLKAEESVDPVPVESVKPVESVEPTASAGTEESSTDGKEAAGDDFSAILPQGWHLLESPPGTPVMIEGDLNKDGIDDIAAVIEKLESEEGAAPSRSLLIALGTTAETYELSVIAENAILSADEGGVWGDPFESIAIDRGSIVVSHYGGSNWRWYSRYRFRYQDEDWYLIGATSGSYNTGATTIENSDEEDYNLLTGDFSIRRMGDDGKTTTETGRGETHPLISLKEFDIRSSDPLGMRS